jgi:hypothetical protein
MQCLVFKEQMSKCFLVVREFGSEKVRCGQDCSACPYLELYFPREKVVVDRMGQRSAQGAQAVKEVETKETGHNILEKGLYKSGQYAATVTNVLRGGAAKQKKS